MSAEAVVKRLAALEAFFDHMFRRAVIDSGDVDYFDVVEEMEKLGLIVSEPYDPEKHGADIEAEAGDVIYVRATP